MLQRREMLAGGLAIGLLPAMARAALPVPAGDKIGFDVIRKGFKLGTHVLTFERSANGLVVHVAVELAYKIAGITLYHYAHRATETWVGDQVVAVQTATDDNGTKVAVTGRRGPAGLVIEATGKPRYTAPADALPATHWNRRELETPWINTQNGELLRPKVVSRGVDAIPVASGATIRAGHYALTGLTDSVPLDLWYDAGGWAGLSFIKSGTPIRYERQG